MRLWHYDLIPYLPRQQLLGQWRELCLIAKNISEKGTPGHVLVNKVTDYPERHLVAYAYIVYHNMTYRGYKPDVQKFLKYTSSIGGISPFNIKTFNSLLTITKIYDIIYLVKRGENICK